MKYVNCGIVFQEIPDEVTLSVNISNCPCRCPGCHSSYLWQNIGEPLDEKAIDAFVEEYGNDITCICLMGGDAEPGEVDHIAAFIKKEYPRLKVGWYSGRTMVSSIVDKMHFDFIKVGPFIRHLGGLKEKTTNQRLYKVDDDGSMTDITSRFWKK